MFGLFWKFMLLIVVLMSGIATAAPIPQGDNPDDFRYPENIDDINNMPMATVRPSVNPCN
ncbi:Protein CBG07454 [Caenorhabditis briggsae]|uniref:Protein CBG07454 n=1 Tax=Caenorhabditis briggsae TaxID=6238 RepID=A8X4Q7_CAEBR|nr:Protein CBG07454 [Caenorhabditis briggsae]CAP27617.1 Protein CBG07454 [Caenorhabditis briggsae]